MLKIPRHIPTFWRSERHKKVTRELGRFLLTVLCSSLLTLWLQSTWGNFFKRSTASVRQTAKPTPNPKSDVPVGKMEDLYRKHLEEIVHTLKAQGGEKIADVSMSSVILKYQRNLASNRDGSAFFLDARTDEAPFMAVSKESRRFLDQMLVVYVVPQDLPPGLIKEALRGPNSINPEVLNDTILIPDLTGDNAAFYSFEKR